MIRNSLQNSNHVSLSSKSICFISPYLPKHTGGGERYLLDCARVLADELQVFVGIPGKHSLTDLATIKEKYRVFLGESLEKITFIETPLFTSASFWQKLAWTAKFNLLYYQTDGSLFFSLAKKNILHIQVPLKLNKRDWLSRLKLANWQVKNTNSEFTKQIVEKSWPVKIDLVHWPMVSLPPKSPSNLKKDHIILNVGRFYRHLHSKRQDVLVDIFAQLRASHPQLLKNWQLVLIGAVEDQTYATEVAELAKDLPIKILHDVSRKDLMAWFEKSAIYWHATGFGLDEQDSPEKVEHFGITTIEAMSRSCVPVVIGLGGQKEILGEKLKSLSWQTKAECISITANLIKNPKQMVTMGQQALARVKVFNQDRFKKQLEEMIS